MTSKQTSASAIQKQFWLLDKLQPENSAYNIPSVFYISGDLRIEVLEDCIEKIVQRHEIFRTVFQQIEAEIYQIILEENKNKFTILDFKSLSPSEKGDAVQKTIKDEINHTFDLEKGPLLRTTLIQTENDQYVLIILMHHIITDLRSKEIFSSELSSLYNSAIKNNSEIILEKAYQYRGFSSWQNKWLTHESAGSSQYWKETLHNFSGFLNLPADYPRSAVQQTTGGAHKLKFSAEEAVFLKECSKQLNTDIFLILLTAFYVFLFRYSNQKDIIVGVPLTNRRNEEHKNIAGCFVNILPIAIELSENLSFTQTLRLVRMAMLGAHRNQELPYDAIVQENISRRDGSYNPLFQTGFTFEPPMELDLNGVNICSEKLHNGGVQLDLYLTLWETKDELKGFFEYNKNLFDDETAKRMLGNFKVIVNRLCSDPAQNISAVDILTDNERKLLEFDWNKTAEQLPENCLVHSLIEQQVVKTPDAVALLDGDKSITYAELNRQADKLAHYLRKYGVHQGNMVGIFMSRTIEMVTALLAVFKVGGAYVPLDPSFPEERIDYMLQDTNLDVILSESGLRDLLPQKCKASIIEVDSEWRKIEQQPDKSVEVHISDNSLAYVIYTSGSTGKPKGVMVPHRAASNFLLSMIQKPGISSDDVLVAVTTLSFDISVLELFGPLIAGGKTVLASQETASNGEELLTLIEESQATIMQATPTTWYMLMAADWQGGETFKVLCGGEPIPQEMAKELTKRCRHVWNMYGPTETTVWSTCSKINVEDEQITVGRPIDNTQIYIVNNKGQLTPVGVSGEMLIGGDGVTQGYLNRLELTTEKFIPNIFGYENKGEKLYRTGDLASYLPDGTIKVHGRMDNQVKVRGFRIELGEVESVLETFKGVKQAVAIVREDEPGDKRLAAYFVPKKGEKTTIQEIKLYLQKKLPSYMVPSSFVQLNEMPMTLNGKVDRKQLPQPNPSSDVSTDSIASPATATEKLVADLWRKILKVDVIDSHANFFDIGGNSLLSIYFVSKLEGALGKKLPIVKFYQYPTINSLAKYLKDENSQSGLSGKVSDRARLQRSVLAKRRKFVK